MIEKALNEAKCVVVLWSERSVQSRYVRDEATYALDRDKLVPVAIENVNLPFRFTGSPHAELCLVGMAQKTARSFAGLSRTSLRSCTEPIAVVPGKNAAVWKPRSAARWRPSVPEQESQQSEEEVRRKAEQADRGPIEQEVPNPWRTYGPVAAVVAVVLVIFIFVFWWPKSREAPKAPVKGSVQSGTKQEIPPVVDNTSTLLSDTAKNAYFFENFSGRELKPYWKVLDPNPSKWTLQIQ